SAELDRALARVGERERVGARLELVGADEGLLLAVAVRIAPAVARVEDVGGGRPPEVAVLRGRAAARWERRGSRGEGAGDREDARGRTREGHEAPRVPRAATRRG